MIDWRRAAPPALVSVGAAGVVLGAVSPWVRSGAAQRSSFEMAALVDRLGVAPDGPIGLAVRLWALVPLFVVTAAACVWWGKPVPGAVLAAIGGLYASAVSVAVWRARDVGTVHVLDGPARTLAGAAVLIVGAAVTVATRPTRRGARARPSTSPAGR